MTMRMVQWAWFCQADNCLFFNIYNFEILFMPKNIIYQHKIVLYLYTHIVFNKENYSIRFVFVMQKNKVKMYIYYPIQFKNLYYFAFTNNTNIICYEIYYKKKDKNLLSNCNLVDNKIIYIFLLLLLFSFLVNI